MRKCPYIFSLRVCCSTFDEKSDQHRMWSAKEIENITKMCKWCEEYDKISGWGMICTLDGRYFGYTSPPCFVRGDTHKIILECQNIKALADEGDEKAIKLLEEVVLTERKSRKEIIIKLSNKTQANVISAIDSLERSCEVSLKATSPTTSNL